MLIITSHWWHIVIIIIIIKFDFLSFRSFRSFRCSHWTDSFQITVPFNSNSNYLLLHNFDNFSFCSYFTSTVSVHSSTKFNWNSIQLNITLSPLRHGKSGIKIWLSNISMWQFISNISIDSLISFQWNHYSNTVLILISIEFCVDTFLALAWERVCCMNLVLVLGCELNSPIYDWWTSYCVKVSTFT